MPPGGESVANNAAHTDVELAVAHAFQTLCRNTTHCLFFANAIKNSTD